eukprot:10051163-Karenia_brevis.AAC.1
MASTPCGHLPQHSHASSSSVLYDASAEVDSKNTPLKDFNAQDMALSPCGPLPQHSHASPPS